MRRAISREKTTLTEKWGTTIALVAIGVGLIITLGVLAGVVAQNYPGLLIAMLWTAALAGVAFVGHLLHSLLVNRKLFRYLEQVMRDCDCYDGVPVRPLRGVK